jgi:hypothetical protein
VVLTPWKEVYTQEEITAALFTIVNTKVWKLMYAD